MRLIRYLFLLFFVVVITNAFGYKPRRTNTFSSYNEHANEIGYAVNLSYFKYEKVFFPQLHLHYSKYLTNFFSLGVGYGGIYDKHFHNTLNLELSFRLYRRLIFTLKPGIAYKKQDAQGRLLYSMGMKTNYEFTLSDEIHIGPMLAIDILQDDVNYLAGFHMGFTF